MSLLHRRRVEVLKTRWKDGAGVVHILGPKITMRGEPDRRYRLACDWNWATPSAWQATSEPPTCFGCLVAKPRLFTSANGTLKLNNTKRAELLVASAAARQFGRGVCQRFYEHDQWWVRDGDDQLWAVHESSGPNGIVFERL